MAEPSHRITIVDLDIPFGRLIAIMVKVTFAAIPATIAVALIFSVVFGLIAAMLGLPLTR